MKFADVRAVLAEYCFRCHGEKKMEGELSLQELATKPHFLQDIELTTRIVEALPHWPSSPLFDDRQRACLAYTEQHVIDVATMDDETVARIVAVLGPDGAADFAHELLVIEQRLRLTMIWDRLFPVGRA